MNQLDEVVKFVIYKCRENNNPVTETLAAFVAQTILNTSKNTTLLYPSDHLSEAVSRLLITLPQTLMKFSKKYSLSLWSNEI